MWHSYGGWVISAAVEQIEGKVSAIVFVDAYLPEDGERGVDVSVNAALIEAAYRSGEIARPKPTAESFGVNVRDRAWVDSMLTDHPIGVSLQPIRLTGARDRVLRKAYVRATRWPCAVFDRYRDSVERKEDGASGNRVV